MSPLACRHGEIRSDTGTICDVKVLEDPDERGFTLPEVIVSVGIAAFVLAATLAAVLPAVQKISGDPIAAALRTLVDREMHVAIDVLKYSGASLTPVTIATTVPIPGLSPVPVTLQLQAASRNSVQIQNAVVSQMVNVTISARDASGKHTAQTQSSIITRAPQPGTTIAPPGLVPAPTGAP